MKTTIRTLATALFAAALAQATLPIEQSKPTVQQSEAKIALERLKTLSGSWQGVIMNIPITFAIRAASSGTVVVHEGNTTADGPPKNEITMFYLDGERLLATHYCDAGNRSQMEGKMSEDGRTIKFSFLEVVGSKRGGYMKDITFTWVGADKHVVEVTFVMPNGEPIPLRGEFARIK